MRYYHTFVILVTFFSVISLVTRRTGISRDRLYQSGPIMNTIKIQCQGSEPIHFDIDDLHLPLRVLKGHFPTAISLSYLKYGKICPVQNECGNLKLVPYIKTYTVVTAEDLQDDADLYLRQRIQELFRSRYYYKEIVSLLQKEDGIEITVRQLKRILKSMNLRRKLFQESPLELIVAAVYEELQGPGKNLGYRPMYQRLRKDYKLQVRQETVLRVLRVLDPAGIERRSRYRLKRRLYVVPGPNYLWHIDGFDKLKKYGFAVNGCVDGYSRKVIYMRVSTTNNKPQVIAHYFLDAIAEHGCIPANVRTDRGTENQVIEVAHVFLRQQNEDEQKYECFWKGKSTANERIEKYWKQLRNSTLGFYMDLFQVMENKGILDRSDMSHIEILRYCFGHVIDQDLQRSSTEWNEHRMRKQNEIRAPSGIPNVMYHCPELSNGVECKKHVNLDVVERIKEKLATPPILYKNSTETLLKILIPDISVPTNCRDACELFMLIKDLRAIVDRHRD